MLEWISEAEALPPVAQEVLYTRPHEFDRFWRIAVAMILIRYEGAQPHPVKIGDKRPVTFWWGFGRSQETLLLNGTGYWAKMTGLPLPPGAQHTHIRGGDYITKTV